MTAKASPCRVLKRSPKPDALPRPPPPAPAREPNHRSPAPLSHQPPRPPAKNRRHGKRHRAPTHRAPAARQRRGSGAGRRTARSSARPARRPCRWRRSSAPAPAHLPHRAGQRFPRPAPPARATGPVPFFTMRPDAGHRDQRLHQRFDQDLGPGRVRLHHGQIAEPVDHHAGQTVSLGVDQPVERGVEQRSRSESAAGDPTGKPRVSSTSAAGSRSSIRAMILELGLTVTRPIG
jgi:hypothetical protein